MAFATVYLVWGSTYLAIRIGVSDAPAILFAGARFLIAAPIMLAYAWFRGAQLPRSRRDWLIIVATALLMLVGANGLVTWSEQWVDSNQAALIVATSALWMAWFGTWGARGERLPKLTIAGLLIGFAGVAVLVGVGVKLHQAPLSAYAALLLSPVLWAGGSVVSRRYPTTSTPLMTAALQMLVTGVVMTTLGLLNGDLARWHPTPSALGALIYLAVLGSCVAYGAYYWLVHEVTPAQLGTYAYVNPAVAVVLGWLVLGEALHPTQMLGTAIVLGSVILVTVASRRSRR
ncbi:EamA family transporter [Sinimarinibacterium sp. CAU 1509]|uniref:EamA family transporter n=1 Tax=Sinimarinibacterium sp. CAU 1509 TaxID=2562283 RepID=UPI00200B891B|nr:EamA family transporter [Sinimarinibacterium sp. CAU 1509]